MFYDTLKSTLDVEPLILFFSERNTLNTNEGLSVYARLFDETSPEWKNNAHLNKTILVAQQNYWNHRLVRDGFVFLNEVYQALGFDRTPAGQIIGWLNNSHDGAGYIDFGIFEERNNDFINGNTPNIWLDFNVDGVMYDKIPTTTQGALMGDEETTTTTETTTTEVKAPEVSTPAQDVVDEVHEAQAESAPVVEETTTTVTEETTDNGD